MFHQNLKHRAVKLGLRGGDLAALINLSAPKMSNFFRGRSSLDAAKLRELIETLDDLERLKTFFPVPVGGTSVAELAVALDRFRQGKFTSFEKLTKAINWETPEGLERKFPKIFKEKKHAYTERVI